MVAEDYQKVLKNIRKEEVRKKKKKTEKDENDDDDENDDEEDGKSKLSRRHKTSLFDSDDEDEIEQFVEADWVERMDDDDDDKDYDKRRKTQPKFDLTSRLSNKTTKSYIREMADGDPIDLLDPSTSKNVFSKIPDKYRSNTNQANSDESNLDNDKTIKLKTLPTSSDGRILIKDLLEQIEKQNPSNGSSTKRKAEDKEVSDDEDDDKDEPNDVNTMHSYQPGGGGIHRPVSVAGSKRSARSYGSKNRAASMISRGDVYSSKSARGDMKRRGRPDPFAYYPLNPIATNKRKTQKYKGEFKALVSGAKKGSAAGVRMKNKRKKTNK